MNGKMSISDSSEDHISVEVINVYMYNKSHVFYDYHQQEQS